MAFTVRAIRPCFSQVAFLKTKYWSHYADIERKIFDEMCAEHAKSFAKVCIHQYFQSVNDEMHRQQRDDSKGDDEDQTKEDDELLGISSQEDMNKVLWNWHISKPPLSLRKHGASADANKEANGSRNGMKTGYDNITFTTDQNGYENGYITSKNEKSYTNGKDHVNKHTCNGYNHLPSIKKKEWAVYYSKV